jgi:hypothetical protein
MLHPLFGGEPIGHFSDASSLLLTQSKKIPTWVQSLSFPSLQYQKQILQELYKRKLNSTTQISHRCGVPGPPNVLWTSLYSKHLMVIAVATATATWYSAIPLWGSTTQHAEQQFYLHYAA